MECLQTALPVKLNLLVRPRILELMDRAVRKTLVTVQAGPGYGKTCEVAVYARKERARLVWLHISHLDNVAGQFWNDLTRAVEKNFPNIAEKCRSCGFPGTASSFDSLLRMITTELYGGDPVLFAVDDFELISDSQILYFFRSIIEANIENFCMVLISNAKTDIGLSALLEGRLFQITQDDLKFTADETRELFSHYGHELTDERLKAIGRDIDGWPMALYILAQRPDALEDSADKTKLAIVYEMFERDFFSSYSPAMQKRLINLSMIPWFPREISQKIGHIPREESDRMLKSNLFISYDYNSKLFTLQNMYRSFLASKIYMLTEEEKREFWQTAGGAFFSHGLYMEAIECFELSGDHSRMLDAITEFIRKFVIYSRNHSNYLLKKLSLLSAEFIDQNHTAEFLTAVCLTNKLELDKAYEMLERMPDKLKGLPEMTPLLGEVYWLMGQVRMLEGKPAFAQFFKLSSDCLPQGADTKGYLHIRNMDVLGGTIGDPGVLDLMEKELYDAMPHYVKAARGGGSGLEHLYSTELAYARFDFRRAKQKAHETIFTAMAAGQHDILCNGHIMLSRIAIMQGDFRECVAHATFVRDYINERGMTELYEMRDCAMATLYVAVGDYGSMAHWIVSPELNVVEKDRPLAIGGREKIIQAEYLLGTERYDELLGFLDYNEALYRKQSRWVNVLKCLVLRAAGLLKAQDVDSAVKSFWEAYEMARENGVIAPFVESGSNMRRMTETARKSAAFSFDPAWLDDLSRKSATHAKRLASLASEYYSSAKPEPARKLSKREIDVLNNLSQGFTREEIAAANSLSINTVKSVIKSVYNKLGAVNRADAVRIATSLRLLK
jgi:LuxR family maltose regulon positive regulatory protein